MLRWSKDTGSGSSVNEGGVMRKDALMWSQKNEEYNLGEFSLAVEQSNGTVNEDGTAHEDYLNVQVDTGPGALFVGIYDGRDSKHASEFLATHLLSRIVDSLYGNNDLTGDLLKSAIYDTEDSFMKHVKLRYREKNRQSFAKSGSSCLVAFVWKENLHIANLGDSRAILYFEKKGKMEIQQLTTDHNLKNEAVRNEFEKDNPQDPNVAVETPEGTWLIKGISKVTRSFGDCYLKEPIDNLYESETGPIVKPLISSEPEICERAIIKGYKFLIAASSGFWDLISNEEAVDLVKSNSRAEIAKTLLTTALAEAARRKGSSYEELIKIPKGRSERGKWHDDICVVIVFFDRKGSKWYQKKNKKIKIYSHRAFSRISKESDFEKLEEKKKKKDLKSDAAGSSHA